MTTAGGAPCVPSATAGRRPRVAIAHDYLTQRGGAERVVLSLLRAFPEATVHTTVYDPDGTYPEFAAADIVVSPLNRVGLLRRHHRALLPLLPWAIRRLQIDAEVVIASSSGWAHGVPASGHKVVYCYSPARWLYQTDRYLGDRCRLRALSWFVGRVLAPLRSWDRRAAATADRYLAISTTVRGRIRQTYGWDAQVVPAPVTLPEVGVTRRPAKISEAGDGSYFLLVSRLLPYKNVEAAVEAFRGSGARLVVVGAGPLKSQIEASLPAEVQLLSDLDEAELRWCYANAVAVVAPSHEDFGLTPLEGGAHGKPAVVLRAGGYLDTMVEGESAVFFDRPEPAEILAAVRTAASRSWDERRIRDNAARFSEERFHATLRRVVAELIAAAS